jgi:hypothetical protein
LAGFIFWSRYAGNNYYPIITFNFVSLTVALADPSEASINLRLERGAFGYILK